MKRCPQCHRVETDEALKFCRIDGTTLVSDSSQIGDETGTAQLTDDASEVHTSILPHRTDANIDRPTAPTTVLPAQSAPITTSQLTKTKRRRTGIAIAVVVTAVAAAVTAIIVRSFLSSKSGKSIESIAVMPFVNESANADVEYLSDGMTETLIKSLSQLPNLAVKSRSTVFYYKGKDTSPKKIGEELKVQAVLLGRVAQRGGELKLSLELVNTQTQDVIWSEQYDRKQSDLVSLQSEIARDVSSKLKAKLSGADEAKVTKTSTANPEAYEAYLKGRYYWNRRTAENLKRGIEQFKLATDRDPNFALAYVGLADCYSLLTEYAGIPTSETAPLARTYAERALSLDPQLGEAHTSLGFVHAHMWHWTESEREFKRALELNPNYPTAYQWYQVLLRYLGRTEEAMSMVRRAKELDPLSGVFSVNISQNLQTQNNTEASIENSLKTIELDPNFGAAYSQLALSYVKKGHKTGAVATAEKAAELTKRANDSLGYLGYVYGTAGKRAEANAVIKELEDRYARKAANGQDVAAVYTGLGDKDKAFEWLEKDFQARSGLLPAIRWMAPFESLRDDPRFKDLLKRMNLAE
jgi:TolB-like protein/Tfp pilus assembly protein PilF